MSTEDLTTKPGIYWNFTETCRTCGDTVQYTDGAREPHPCPEGPALVIEGCEAEDFATRLNRALDDYEAISGRPVDTP